MARLLGLLIVLFGMNTGFVMLDSAVAQNGEAHVLAPGGTLRVGVVLAPQAGVFFVATDAAGVPHGVTVDLAKALGRHLGVPVAFSVFPNSGECTDSVAKGEVDVAFMPVDPARSARVTFGPGYYVLESTYLVSGVSGITSLAGVDRAGVRVVGIADTTTIRAAARSLSHTQPIASRGVDEAIAMIRDGRADALALSRDSLNQILPTVPGALIVDGGFQQTTVSIAVPPGRPAAAAAARAWMDAAKHDGTVRRAFDALGLTHEAVAP